MIECRGNGLTQQQLVACYKNAVGLTGEQTPEMVVIWIGRLHNLRQVYAKPSLRPFLSREHQCQHLSVGAGLQLKDCRITSAYSAISSSDIR